MAPPTEAKITAPSTTHNRLDSPPSCALALPPKRPPSHMNKNTAAKMTRTIKPVPISRPPISWKKSFNGEFIIGSTSGSKPSCASSDSGGVDNNEVGTRLNMVSSFRNVASTGYNVVLVSVGLFRYFKLVTTSTRSSRADSLISCRVFGFGCDRNFRSLSRGEICSITSGTDRRPCQIDDRGIGVTQFIKCVCHRDVAFAFWFSTLGHVFKYVYPLVVAKGIVFFFKDTFTRIFIAS